MKPVYDFKATCFDKRGKVISVGYNSYTKTHPIQGYYARRTGNENKEFLHAEIQALLRARDRKVDSILVERYNNEGKPLNAFPCEVCQAALEAWGVTKISSTSTEHETETP